MLSLIHTYKYELTLMVGASLRLAGRYEPYGLICRWLNVRRRVGAISLELQGMDSANGLFV